MKTQSTDVEPRNPRDTAHYIETMARDLKALAAGAGFGFLAYLLSMVEDDAASEVRRLDGGG